MYCENKHRKQDRERHDKICNKTQSEEVPTKNVTLAMSQLELEAPYKLVEIEGKGRGLVATRSLEVGDLVLSEKAFLKAPNNASMGFTKSFFLRLKPDIRAKLMNLSSPADTELKDQILLMINKVNANCAKSRVRGA